MSCHIQSKTIFFFQVFVIILTSRKGDASIKEMQYL
jgi:hypothetical protein